MRTVRAQVKPRPCALRLNSGRQLQLQCSLMKHKIHLCSAHVLARAGRLAAQGNQQRRWRRDSIQRRLNKALPTAVCTNVPPLAALGGPWALETDAKATIDCKSQVLYAPSLRSASSQVAVTRRTCHSFVINHAT